MRDFSKIKDRFGGIDKDILDIVIALNNHGLKTLGSCSGHLDRDRLFPTPYVNLWLNPSQYTKRDKWHHDISRKLYLSKLIKKFNTTRNVSKNDKIHLTYRKEGLSTIYCGGEDHTAWVRNINKIVHAKELGKPYDKLIMVLPSQKKHAARTLPRYQKEMKRFAIFLEKELALINK